MPKAPEQSKFGYGPRGVQRWDPENPDETRFGPGYEPTEDEAMLIERARVAHQVLVSAEGRSVDPFEMLRAVIWPTEKMLEAQREAGLE